VFLAVPRAAWTVYTASRGPLIGHDRWPGKGGMRVLTYGERRRCV